MPQSKGRQTSHVGATSAVSPSLRAKRSNPGAARLPLDCFVAGPPRNDEGRDGPEGGVPARPKSLASPATVQRRRALCAAPHIARLRPLLDALRRDGEVPDPDPLDGGADARLLLLLETPGPRIRTSGFVSRDNPSETSANLFRALAEAEIARRDTLIWNTVPWIIHAPGALNRAPRRAEIAAGIARLPDWLDALPRLACIVLAGRVAAEAAPVLSRHRSGLPVLRMPHPSPTYLCTSPTHPARVRAAMAEAAAILGTA